MKRLRTFCFALAGACLLASTVYAMDIFTVKTASTTPIPLESCAVSVAAGEVLELDPVDLERRMGIEPGSLSGITITALPGPEQGGVFLDGVEAELYDFLSREDIGRLCFVPSDQSAGASITFLPQGSEAVATSLSIQVLSQPNQPPQVESLTVETVENVSISGFITAADPDGDTVQIKLAQPPRKGEVTFQGQSFQYDPYQDQTGLDSFTVYAVDSYHNYSDETMVEVLIEADSLSFRYADMTRHPSNYAAIKLQEKGVYTGVQAGNRHYFHPDEQMRRGDFVILLLAAAGLEDGITPTVNTGLPNDSEIPVWLKPYVKRAAEEGIISSDQAFAYNEVPIRAEAVLMTDRAADITDVKEFPLQMGDSAAIPDWALESYRDLAAYKMLDLHDGNAYPDSALTNSYAADLAWQLWKHRNR